MPLLRPVGRGHWERSDPMSRGIRSRTHRGTPNLPAGLGPGHTAGGSEEDTDGTPVPPLGAGGLSGRPGGAAENTARAGGPAPDRCSVEMPDAPTPAVRT